MGNKTTMNQLFGKQAVKQNKPDPFWPLPSELIGIEIETENFRRSGEAAEHLSRWWTTHSDASLRSGIEWVLHSPLSGTELREAVGAFFAGRYSYSMSERTSTHIHINASDQLSVDQFRNVFVLMYLIEPAVFRWADENRKWCGYCQPLTDMSPQRLAGVLLDDTTVNSFVRAVTGEGNSDRYYGLNIASFNRHGTLEFRYFPCVDNEQVLIDWIKFVMQVKRAACAADNPLEILANFDTHEGIERFLTEWFDDNAPVIQRGLDYSDVVRRSVDLQALITNKLSSVLNSSAYIYSEAVSKGLSKLLSKSFKIGSDTAVKKTKQSAAAVAATRQNAANDLWARIMQQNPNNSSVADVYARLNEYLSQNTSTTSL